jgi:hypothetical protein
MLPLLLERVGVRRIPYKFTLILTFSLKYPQGIKEKGLNILSLNPNLANFSNEFQ